MVASDSPYLKTVATKIGRYRSSLIATAIPLIAHNGFVMVSLADGTVSEKDSAIWLNEHIHTVAD